MPRTNKEIEDLFSKVKEKFKISFGVDINIDSIQEIVGEFLKNREREFVRKMITHIPDCDMYSLSEYCKTLSNKEIVDVRRSTKK